MLRRLTESIVVAATASIVTWAVSNRDDAAGAAGAGMARVLRGVASYGSPIHNWLWLTAAALVVLAICLQVLSMAPTHPKASWEWSLLMPSWPTTLMAVGVAVSFLAAAVGLAEAGSVWALPLLAVVAYWAYRWMAGVRHRWTSMVGAL